MLKSVGDLMTSSGPCIWKTPLPICEQEGTVVTAPEFMGKSPYIHKAQQPATLTDVTTLGSAQGGNLLKNRGKPLGLEVWGFLCSDHCLWAIH